MESGVDPPSLCAGHTFYFYGAGIILNAAVLTNFTPNAPDTAFAAPSAKMAIIAAITTYSTSAWATLPNINSVDGFFINMPSGLYVSARRLNSGKFAATVRF
jgi:hypothetical protein